MFDGKIAIVTGGATGIGAATARMLAAQGAHVIVTSEQTLETLETFSDRLIAEGGEASAIRCDVTDQSAITALMAEVARRFSRLDILINCAGVSFLSTFETMPVENIVKCIAVNLLAPILLTKAALALMRASGGGAIVNVASGAALLGIEGMAVYAATKAGLMQFTRTLAPELRRSGIRVNTVGPGSTRTPMLGFTEAELTEAQTAAMARRAAVSVSPYGNPLIEPDDIASVILFAASDAARAMQGSYLLADQGVTAAIRPPDAPA